MGQDPRPQGSWIPLESGVCLGEQTRSQVTVIKCQVIISDRRVTSLGPAPVDATPCGHSLPSHCLPLSLIPRGEKTNFLILPHQLSSPAATQNKVNYLMSNSILSSSGRERPHRLCDLSEGPSPPLKAIMRFHAPHCDSSRVHLTGFSLSIWRVLSVWKQGCCKLTAQ